MLTNNGSKISILLVSLNPFYGGGENYLRKLFLLFKEEYYFHVIACDDQLYNFFRSQNVHIVKFDKTNQIIEKLYFFVKITHFVRQYCRQHKINIVILNGPAGAYILPGLIGIQTIKVIVRQTELALSPFLLRVYFVMMVYLANRVVCVSENIRKQLSGYVPDYSIVKIPHWIEYSILESLPVEQMQDSEDVQEQVINILFVGRIEHAKGWRELVMAVDGMENIRVNFVGAGDEYQYAKENVSSSNIVFHGFATNVAKFYELSDIFVSPSHSEGMPMVLLEAMSAGLPCLISNIPPHQEVSDHGSAALLFECKNAVDLRNKLKLLLDDTDLRKQFALRAYTRVMSTYSAYQVKADYRSLFTDLL